MRSVRPAAAPRRQAQQRRGAGGHRRPGPGDAGDPAVRQGLGVGVAAAGVRAALPLRLLVPVERRGCWVQHPQPVWPQVSLVQRRQHGAVIRRLPALGQRRNARDGAGLAGAAAAPPRAMEAKSRRQLHLASVRGAALRWSSRRVLPLVSSMKPAVFEYPPSISGPFWAESGPF